VNHINLNKKKNPNEKRTYHVICSPKRDLNFERIFEREAVWQRMY
jgi:hypothetical protein